MKRSELEHIIRAAGSIANDNEIIVIGSQAILGQFPDAPQEFLLSMEADIIPKNREEMSDLIDGTIGELSPFHKSFGYYAHGVTKNTAILPRHWMNRLITIFNPNTNGIKGLCLEIHDLAISKYMAGREKDLSYASELAKEKLASKETLLERLKQTDADPKMIQLTIERIHRNFP